MKVQYTNIWGATREVESVYDFVESELLTSYSDGALEVTQDQARRVARGLSNLVDILTHKGLLSIEDVQKISGTCLDDAVLIPDS